MANRSILITTFLRINNQLLFLVQILYSQVISPMNGLKEHMNPMHKLAFIATMLPLFAYAPLSSARCAPTTCNTCDSGYFEVIAGYGLASLGVGDANVGLGEVGNVRLHQDDSNHAGDATIGVGYTIPLLRTSSNIYEIGWLPGLSTQLNFHHLTKGLSGELTQRSNPDFDNVDYNLSINSSRVMIDFALTLAQLQKFSVFVIGGAGESWTKVNYNNRVRAGRDRDRVILNQHTNSGFASEIGAGATLDVSCNFAVSLQYLYTNFNDIQTARKGTLNGRAYNIGNAAHFAFHTQEVLLLLRLK